MKICVTATAGSLDASFDPHFGRCRYFVIVDTDSMTFETIKNKSSYTVNNKDIIAAQLLLGRDIDKLITGKMESKAFSMLFSKGIDILSFTEGSVKNALQSLKDDALKVLAATSSPSDQSYEVHVRGYRRFRAWLKSEISPENAGTSRDNTGSPVIA